jgi:hypothetical protein
MRYVGGYDYNRPWNDVTNPLVLRRSEPWRQAPTRDFSGGSMEGLVSSVSQVSDYLYDTGYETEVAFLGNRGYNGGKHAMAPWSERYPSSPSSEDIEPDYFAEYGEESADDYI